MHRHFDEPHPFAFETARTHYAADRPVKPVHLALDLKLDFPKKALSGTCSTSFLAVRAVKEVRFDAVDLEVGKVTVDGKVATFKNDGRHLTVALPRAAKVGQTLEIAVSYGCTPRRGLYFVGPDASDPTRPLQAWTQGQDEDSRHWFPCLDAPAQKATTEVKATFPESMRALSNGRVVSDSAKGGKRTTLYRLDQPHSPYLVTLVVGDFEEHVATSKGGTVVRTLFPRGKKDEALRCAKRTPAMIDLFEALTGQQYPWGDYAQIFTAEFIFGGMENTGATTLTDVVLHDERAALDYNVEPLISHELAHQWFGDLLTCRDWPHGWLNEGFATYFEVLWKEHGDSLDEADHQRGVDLGEYLSEAGERYARPLVTRHFDAPIDVFDRHLYEKGALVLHALRARLGDDDFFASLKGYVATHKQGAVETVDLARAVEATTGKNLDAFFDQWAHREGHPEVQVETGWDGEAKKVRLAVKQTQQQPFAFPLRVELVVGGKSTEHTLEVTGAEHVFLLSAASEPSQLVVDGRREVLGTLDEKKSPAQWCEQLAHGASARARTEAARALGKDGSGPNLAACKKTLLDEKAFWATRAACATALATMRSPAAKAALLAATGLKHPRARRAVAAALGRFVEDAEVGEALKTWADKGDPSVFVEAEAARSLGRVRAAGARKVLEKLLTRTTFQDTVGTGALDGLAELQDPAGWDAVVARTKVGQPMFGRRAAYLAVAKLAEVAGKKTEAVHLIERALSDVQFRVQMGAFDAAATLNDGRLLGALSSTPFLDGRARRAAKETARAIREGTGAKRELTALRGELEKLKADVRALQQGAENKKR
jgi:aminopeptidase N